MKKDLDIDTYLNGISNLSSKWKEEIKRHCVNGCIYSWYMEGEQGCGKSTAAIWILLWKLYELLIKDEDIHNNLGLIKGSKITVSTKRKLCALAER